MVSLNPNPLKGFVLSPMGMSLPNIGSLHTATATATAVAAPPSTILSSDDQAKKVRKPYTITKSRESWTEPEHDKFLEALQLFDRDWKKIEAFVGSKTVIQIRSHAQKFFLKVQKSGTNEHLPPPRPKRKAAHPYPQKASKNAPVPLQVTASFQALPALPETQYLQRVDSTSLIMNPVTSAAVSCWTDSSMQTVSLTNVPKDNIKSAKKLMAHNCCSSSESTPSPRPASEMTDQGKHGPSMRVLPDFARVYSFIGSVFDPNASGHLQKLKKMDPIDVETVLLLMRNLFINLSSPDFEDHRRLLSCYEIDAEKKDNPGTRDKILHDNKSEKAA